MGKIIVPARKAQQIGWLTLAFRHKGEAAHFAAAIILRHILHLSHMMLAAGKAGRIAIMFGNATNAVMAFPDVGIVEHFLDHARVGREAGDKPLDIAGVERPAIGGDQVLQGKAVLD